MRIREENCNMILLAVVTLFTPAIAGGASCWALPTDNPVRLADRTTGRTEQPLSPDKQLIYVTATLRFAWSARRSSPTPIPANVKPAA